jgi:hypothetical protein
LEIIITEKSPFPALDGWGASAKNKGIPLLLDYLGCHYEEFHEEAMVGLTFGFFHHSMKRQIHAPTNSQVGLASLTELAGEEQMEGCFLAVPQTQHTIVVVVLEFVFFPS